MKKNENTPPPPGLEHLVPNSKLLFCIFLSPSWNFGKVPMCVCGGGGDCSCNASLSRPNVQKNSRALVRGMGGLKF